jgi:hypothetical protein
LTLVIAPDVLAALLPLCNAFIVSFAEQRISIYVRPGMFLATRTGMGQLYKQSIFNPASRSAPMPCGFFSNGEMRQANIPQRWGT